MTNGEKIQKVFNCEVCEPIPEDDIIHVIFADKKDSAIGFDLSWWNMEYKEPTTKSETLVNLDVYKQVAKERDIAIEQLHELGYEFGQKIEPTTKSDLGVDREQLKAMIRGLTKWYVKRDNTEVGEPNTAVGLLYDDVMFGIDRLLSVTPQEPQTFRWCTDCKEYDQEKHCCHRWSKVIRDTVEEMKQEPRWIPVSERLPENKETVLATFKHFVSGNTIGLGNVILLRGKPYWHIREQNLGVYEVLAWMPLPKSYEPQESEDKE